MSDFAPGDVVVCVDDSPCKSGCPRLCHDLRAGRHYRIKALYGATALVPAGADMGPHTGVWIGRFRKIDKSDEGFAAWMRSMRPVKQPAREHALTPSGNPS